MWVAFPLWLAAVAAAVPVEARADAAGSPATARPPLEVLVLYSDHAGYPGKSALDAALRVALAEGPEPVQVYSEFLDQLRLDPTGERQARALEAKYAGVDLDLVIAEDSAATTFTLLRRSKLFPGRPVLFVHPTDRDTPGSITAGPAALAADGISGLSYRYDLGGTLALAARLFPGTRRVALVSGADRGDREYHEALVRCVREARLEPLPLVGLPMDELLQRVAALPDDVIVFVGSNARDGAGRVTLPRDVADRVSAAANRPAFSSVETFFGRGLAGGVLLSPGEVGREIARLARQVLEGEPLVSLPPRLISPSRAAVDGRVLRRFGVPLSRVPAGVEVRFPSPTAWEQYQVQILVGAGLLAAQGALIGFLLAERRRRRAAEAAAHGAAGLELRLARLDRVASLGALSSSLAHELGQPLTSIAASAHAARAFLCQAAPDFGALKEICTAIDADSRRAGEVIRRMRRLVEQGEVTLEAVSLESVAAAACQHVAAAARSAGVTLDLDARHAPLVAGDPVHLLQAALNLSHHAVAGARRGPGPARHVWLRVGAEPGGARLVVEDDGPGLAPEQREAIFDPYGADGQDGAGLGLYTARSIVERLGGRLLAEDRPGGGARFVCSLPAAANPAREARGGGP